MSVNEIQALAQRFADGFDKWDVNDFAQDPATLNSIAQPSYLMIGYVTRPYTANSIWARLTYFW